MTRRCPDGHENPPGARYCIVCGQLVTSELEATATNGAAGGGGAGRSPRPRKRLLMIVGAVLAGCAVAGLVGFFALTSAAPDVMGKSPEAARSAVVDAGFVVGAQTKDFSPSVDRGSVMAQSPGAGQRARRGGAIDLVISRGPAVTVPSVEGENASTALRMLKDLTFVTEQRETSSETIPEGTVMAQSLKAGDIVEEGTEIALVVSSGPPTVTMTVVLSLFDGADSCSFSFGYYDIPGADVVIEADGQTVGVGNLPYVGSDEGFYCEYRTTIPNVPNDASLYSLRIAGGNRGEVTSTNSELVGDDWTWEVSLGL